jgi:hypothetical protein
MITAIDARRIDYYVSVSDYMNEAIHLGGLTHSGMLALLWMSIDNRTKESLSCRGNIGEIAHLCPSNSHDAA